MITLKIQLTQQRSERYSINQGNHQYYQVDFS